MHIYAYRDKSDFIKKAMVDNCCLMKSKSGMNPLSITVLQRYNKSVG